MGDKRSPYLVVRLEPSSRASDSMVMAWAGQMASHSLQAGHQYDVHGRPVEHRKGGGTVTMRWRHVMGLCGGIAMPAV